MVTVDGWWLLFMTLWCYWIWIQLCEEYKLYAVWCSTYMEYNLHVCTICCCLYHVVLWCQLSYVPKVLESHLASLLTALLTRISRCVGSVRLKTDSWWLKIVRCLLYYTDEWWLMVGGLLSSDLCIVVVLWHGLILACVLASVDVLWCLICGCALSCLWFCLCWWLYFSYLYLYL